MDRQLVLLGACDRALQALEVLRGLLEQGLDVCRDVDVASAHERLAAAAQAGKAREPFLDVVVKTVLRLRRLQVEKAEHQGAGEAEQRRAKRRTHAAHGGGETRLELFEEHGHQIAWPTDIPLMTSPTEPIVSSRPQNAEQAEEDQQPDLVAGDVAAFIEPGADAAQQIADIAGSMKRRRSCSPSAEATGVSSRGAACSC